MSDERVGAGIDGLAQTLPIASHPLRAALSEEMHLRKFPRIAAPSCMLQVMTLVQEDGGGRSLAHLQGLCDQYGVASPADGRYFACRLGTVDFVWERHTEAVSYTFIQPGGPERSFGPEGFDEVAREWMRDLPGEVIRATQIVLLGRGTAADDEQLARSWFSGDDLVVCDVADGRARIWSDFRLHHNGFGRLLIFDKELVGHEAARLVQRLQELGNYRNMAMLGLPLAQRLTPEVSRLEQRLVALTEATSERRSDDAVLLAELGSMSAELARLMAETRYRMSATHAYAQLCSDRLQSLKVGEVRGYDTLVDFTERRLVPAMRTCDSFSRRLEDLSQRVAWTSSLLRTRVDTSLAVQNRDLLHSMDERTRLQLRLQQTVEGLSVVAISYYMVGLASYLFKGAHAYLPVFQPEVAVGITVPLMVLLAALALRRVHRKLVHC
ncbi:DUF3422 family protein [Pseudomonas sp.]|uniref:DUF3422 family protein n=1 Tax=Pseudomonas sp. TaxID=306 RepID=UPI003D09E12A